MRSLPKTQKKRNTPPGSGFPVIRDNLFALLVVRATAFVAEAAHETHTKTPDKLLVTVEV
jgi:hypothetical protein